MTDFSKIGLDDRLRKETALPKRFKKFTALETEAMFDFQSSHINVSKMNVPDFVKRSDGSGASGTFSASQGLILTSTLKFKPPKAQYRTFGMPTIGVYEGSGTASADMIYPVKGANVTAGRYDVNGGAMDYSNYNGTFAQWRATIYDTNGTSTQDINFISSWMWLDYVTGAGSI